MILCWTIDHITEKWSVFFFPQNKIIASVHKFRPWMFRHFTWSSASCFAVFEKTSFFFFFSTRWIMKRWCHHPLGFLTSRGEKCPDCAGFPSAQYSISACRCLPCFYGQVLIRNSSTRAELGRTCLWGQPLRSIAGDWESCVALLSKGIYQKEKQFWGHTYLQVGVMRNYYI